MMHGVNTLAVAFGNCIVCLCSFHTTVKMYQSKVIIIILGFLAKMYSSQIFAQSRESAILLLLYCFESFARPTHSALYNATLQQ